MLSYNESAGSVIQSLVLVGPLTHGSTNSGVSYVKSVNISLQLSGFVSYGSGVKTSTGDDRHRLGYVFKRGGGMARGATLQLVVS